MNAAFAPFRTLATATLCLSLVAGAAFAAVPPENPLIKVRVINESGGYIKRMQKALAAAGYDPGTIDGIYGKATDIAVKQYLADRAAAKARESAPREAIAAKPSPANETPAAAPVAPVAPVAPEAPATEAPAEEETVAAAPAEAAPAEQPAESAPAAPAAEAPALVDSTVAVRNDRVAADNGSDGVRVAQVTAPTPISEEPVNVPASTPFTGPADGRPMSPPASLAGLEALGDDLGLEGRLLTDALVTTSSKRAQRLQDVPMTVAWIPAEELEGTGAFTLCDAIQYFPGMECRRGAMRKVAVSARGLGSNFLSNRLLLLQDGRPQTDPWTGQFYGDETIPLTNVRQVEVIRGPGSSLYGSNAFSGVINVIRRSPAEVIGEGKDFGVEARALGGQFSTYRAQGTAAGRMGPVEALVNYYGFTSEGANLLGDATQGRVDTQEWSRVHQVSGIVDIGKVVRLDVDYTNAELGRPGGNNISAVGNCGRCHYTPNDAEGVENLNANGQVDLRVNDNLRVFGQAYALFKYREVRLENAVSSEIQTTVGRRNRYGGELRALLSAGEMVNVTVGGDVKLDAVRNRNVLATAVDANGVLDQTILGGYVDAEVRPLPALVLGGGLRYDQYLIPERIWSNPSAQLSPRASIVFHAMERLLTLRTNYGRAFRAPTLAELAINQQMYAATLLGNPGLVAETLDTVEAAVDFWPFEGTTRFTVTGFYNLAKNFINQEQIAGSTSQFQNIGDARVIGFEAEAAAQIKEINSSFDIAYQYLDARSLAFNGRPESPLDYAPNHRVYFRGRTNLGSVAFVEAFAVFVSGRRDPAVAGDAHERVTLEPYLTANARIGANVSKGLSISLLGSNIFNSQHQESFGFPVPGASVYGEIKFRY